MFFMLLCFHSNVTASLYSTISLFQEEQMFAGKAGRVAEMFAVKARWFHNDLEILSIHQSGQAPGSPCHGTFGLVPLEPIQTKTKCSRSHKTEVVQQQSGHVRARSCQRCLIEVVISPSISSSEGHLKIQMQTMHVLDRHLPG